MQQCKSTTYQEMHGSPVLIPPKREQRSAHAGMRTSLRETQASREGESHAQEANVAEVSYGKPVMANPSIQVQIYAPPGGERGGVTPA